ncbi:MAG: hypothetical protein RR334_03415, partial [Clostridia bacterium]
MKIIKKPAKIKNIKEERIFKRLQREIAMLPAPSFNNPEHAQPVEVPSVVVPSSVQMATNDLHKEAKQDKPFEQQIILSQPAPKIEVIASIKKPNKASIIKRIMGYLKKYWYLMALTILFAFVNSAFEVLIPLFIGKAVDNVVSAGAVNFQGILNNIIVIAICVLGFALFKWLTSKVANDMSYKIEKNLRID